MCIIRSVLSFRFVQFHVLGPISFESEHVSISTSASLKTPTPRFLRTDLSDNILWNTYPSMWWSIHQTKDECVCCCTVSLPRIHTGWLLRKANSSKCNGLHLKKKQGPGPSVYKTVKFSEALQNCKTHLPLSRWIHVTTTILLNVFVGYLGQIMARYESQNGIFHLVLWPRCLWIKERVILPSFTSDLKFLSEKSVVQLGSCLFL